MQPGRYLNDYLDALKKIEREYSHSKRDMQAVKDVAANARMQGIIFAVQGGNWDNTEDRKLFKDKNLELRPPYPVTILEYVGRAPLAVAASQDYLPRIIVVMDKEDHALLFPIEYYSAGSLPANITHRGWIPPYHGVIVHYDDEGEESYQGGALMVDANNEAKDLFNGTDEEYQAFCVHRYMSDVVTYKKFCHALSRYHVTFDDIEPDEKLNKMRRARGKLPLFTYKVLTIGRKKRKSHFLGGTHASPRSHLRRGHYRTSQKGVRHWVQPCMIKGETDGFVHKDYIVEAVEA